jgi:hypothetical protein
MVETGALDPLRPMETFPWDEYLEECRKRLAGEPDEHQERLKKIRSRVHDHLKQMAEEGWRPHLPPVIMHAEWEQAAALAQRLTDAKPKAIRRRGSVADMTAVLRFVAIKACGGRLISTHERAVRHLGWVDWDLEETAPTVRAARRRLERVLAWMAEGSDKQGALELPPLLRQVQKGYRRSGHSAPSEYEVPWENWGGAFVERASRSREAVGSRLAPGR